MGLLIEWVNGLTTDEILVFKPDFIPGNGWSVSLTHSRSNEFYKIFQTRQGKVILLKMGTGGNQKPLDSLRKIYFILL